MWELIWFITTCLAVYAYAKTRASGIQLQKQAEQLERVEQRIAHLENHKAPQTPASIPESPILADSVAPILGTPAQVEADSVLTRAGDADAPLIEPRAHMPISRPNAEQTPIPKPAWTERLGQLEKTLGLRWTTWIGGLVLFLGAGRLIKHSFEQSWLGPGYRVILGCLAGLGIGMTGLHFIRRQMRALGQGLVGVGLAILYASLYGAYGLYGLLPQTIVFGLMTGVTVTGMIVAVSFDALPIAFMAVLGGFITPIMLGSAQDSRDSLFAYLFLLDIGVLGVAFFRHWRALDLLAFAGTSLMYGAWYAAYHGAPTFSLLPTMGWLTAFYLIFLIEPFAYHLRLGTPIAGERFGLAVTNAMGMFGWAYVILHEQHPQALGMITLTMSAVYLILGLWMRRMIREDRRAIFGFASLFIAFLIIAVPIHLDMHAVTIAWAIKAPILLFLAYKYSYLPMRCASVIPLALAYARLFLFHWPLHSTAFFPVFNTDFGTVLFLLLSGAAYALIHHRFRPGGHLLDQLSEVWVTLGTAFMGLVMAHIEIWQWLDLSDRDSARFWGTSLLWTSGALGFIYAGMKQTSRRLLWSGLIAVAVAGILYACDLFQGHAPVAWGMMHGRFLAGGLAIACVFGAGRSCRCLPELELKRQDAVWLGLYKLGIALTVTLLSIETWLWLESLGQLYAFRCTLPWLWTGGAAACLVLAKRLPAPTLRRTALVYLGTASVLGLWQYAFAHQQVNLLYVNGRCLVALGTLALLFVYARIWLRAPGAERRAHIVIGACALALFLLLNLETFQFMKNHIPDPARSRWVSQMSLSLLWSLYAIAALFIGFRQRIRALRLAALGLFGVTVLKVVLGDMANVEEVYRIVSFIGLGLLMIGASYLYHRVEKNLH